MKAEEDSCIAGMKCPECGHDEDFKIIISVQARVDAEGIQDYEGDHEWDEDSICTCPDCDFTGHVSEFTVGDKDYKRAVRRRVNREKEDAKDTR